MSGSNIKLLEKLLDYTSAKQKVISKNIANVGTLNYQREDVKFEDVLSKEVSSNLRATDPKHISLSNPVYKDAGFKTIKNGSEEKANPFNNVDVNQEMAEMAQNTLLFKFGSRQIRGFYQGMQNVIRGGR